MASRRYRPHALQRCQKAISHSYHLLHAFRKRRPLVLPALVVAILLFAIAPDDEGLISLQPLDSLPQVADPNLSRHITIAIKTYVCDTTGARLLLNTIRAIRLVDPNVHIIIGNDGPSRLNDLPLFKADPNIDEISLAKTGNSLARNAIVQRANTEYLVFLDDDHHISVGTNFSMALRGLQAGEFDLVGFRVWNLPGVEELEQDMLYIPRGAAKVSSFKHRHLTLCLWNENDGPAGDSMRMPIPMDVVHNAFIAKTTVLRDNPWRDVLKLNEMLTFFLDAKENGVRVGYLPSVYVHQAPRKDSPCNQQVIAQESELEDVLPYSGDYDLDIKCEVHFEDRVRQFLKSDMHNRLG